MVPPSKTPKSMDKPWRNHGGTMEEPWTNPLFNLCDSLQKQSVEIGDQSSLFTCYFKQGHFWRLRKDIKKYTLSL
ncbi:MAG: hypothetical protein ACPGSG_07525 [Prolixibacteraceae bacterium]